jgi:serine/threonine protein kinase
MEVDPSARTEAGAAGGAGGAASELGPGMLIGKYRLDRVLGAGGMGVVWAAYDPDLERPVAIKVLRSIDDGATQRTRLLREARAMARLKHANILTVYEVGTDRNRDYIAMELIDGADLDAWLKTRPPRSDIVAALLAAGRGLAAAHDVGLVHRDLKPHNILRGRDGSVYVTDFGLARGQIEDGPEIVQQIALAATEVASGSHPRAYPRGIDSVLDSPLTQTGVLIGTPAYMAPEQFAGRAPDPRTDQFAYCITVWEALTGARPFAGSTLDELRAAASGGVPPAAPELSPRLRAVLVRGLAADPAQRWPDMHVLLRELAAALTPPRRSLPSWRPSRASLLSAAVVIPVVLGVVYLKRDRAPAVDDCGPPEEVFGSAWSAERRQAVVGRHKLDVQSMAATSALDELRRKWLDSYASACEMSPSAARHERLGCLLEVRDDTNEITAEMANDDGKLSVGAIVPLSVSMGMCVASDGTIPFFPQIPGITSPSSEDHPPDPSDPWSSTSPRGPAYPRPPIPPRPPRPPSPPSDE